MKKLYIQYFFLILLGIFIGYLIYKKGMYDYQSALNNYRVIASADSKAIATRTDNDLKQIYQNIRTISLLPNIRNLDRHATNLENNTLAAINEIYHNLSSNVSVSEIYIVPVDLNPDAIDPVTQKAEIPSIMFDGSIAGQVEDDDKSESKLEEVETYEYHQLQQHMLWLKQKYPTNDHLTPDKIPMISGNNIVTCDNTQYKKTLNDLDRTGIILSVPIFDLKGELKGTVSAIILNNVLRDLIAKDIPQHETYSLINTGYQFSVATNDSVHENPYKKWFNVGKPDPNLLYSNVIPLSVNDPLSSWALWVGFDNELFFHSNPVQAIKAFFIISYIFDFAFTLGLMFIVTIISRNNLLMLKNNMQLKQELDEQIAEVKQLAQEREHQNKLIEIGKQNAIQKVAVGFEKAISSIIGQVERTSSLVEKQQKSVNNNNSPELCL